VWYENGTNVVRMVRKKEESVKNEVTTKKKKIKLFLGNYCPKLAQNFAQKVLHHNDAKKMQKMKQKDISFIGAKSARKVPKKVPNEKLVLLSQNDAKMAQILAQKVLTSNELIMSQNMSQKNNLNSFAFSIFNKLLIQYNINGFSFSLPVVGSISKPKASKTMTPSKTLSITSEIRTGKTSSLFFSLINALPLSTFTVPAPVNISSIDEGLIPSSSASIFGKTVRVAPVSTKALTFFDLVFSRFDISTSTQEWFIYYSSDINLKCYLNSLPVHERLEQEKNNKSKVMTAYE
jgi:hypothetical protein